MAMPGEYEFYQKRTGLPASTTLNEQRAFFWRSKTGFPASARLEELEYNYYCQQLALTPGQHSLQGLRHAFFRTSLGIAQGSGMTTADLMAQFFRTAPFTIAWDGTADASTSTMRAFDGTIVRQNFIADPKGKNPANFTVAVGSLASVAGFGAFATAMQHTRDAVGGNARIGIIVGAGMAPSTQYTLVVQVSAAAGITGTASSKFRPTSTSATTGEQTVPYSGSPVGVSEIRASFVTTATAITNTGGFAIFWTGGAISDTTVITGMQCERGATAGAYFDGSTPVT